MSPGDGDTMKTKLIKKTIENMEENTQNEVMNEVTAGAVTAEEATAPDNGAEQAEPTEEGAAEAAEDDGAQRVDDPIAEAERRGYLRGLNERASRLMEMPSQGERCRGTGECAAAEPESEIMILDRRHVSVWER